MENQNLTPELEQESLARQQQLNRIEERLDRVQQQVLAGFLILVAWIGVQPQFYNMLANMHQYFLEKPFEARITEFCKEAFYPYLHPIFAPIDNALNLIPTKPWASICAVGLFVIAMFVVGVVMKESYVNQGRPYKSLWTDLRLWTVICMLPHVIVYFYFT